MRATRRGLLGGSVAMLAAAPAEASFPPDGEGARVPHRDTALLALADQFIEHERRIQAMPCDAEPGTAGAAVQEVEQGLLLDRQHALTVKMGTLRAVNTDGILARARCLAVHNTDGAFSMDDPDTTTGRLLRYLMRDAGALGTVRPVVSSDTGLMGACADFHRLEASQPVPHAEPITASND